MDEIADHERVERRDRGHGLGGRDARVLQHAQAHLDAGVEIERELVGEHDVDLGLGRVGVLGEHAGHVDEEVALVGVHAGMAATVASLATTLAPSSRNTEAPLNLSGLGWVTTR
jgi:hypothetical protein